MKRKWDLADKDTQQKCIDDVISRIEEIQGSQVGAIAAQDIIDIVADHLGPSIYNAGVRDTKKLLQQRMADLEIDIDLLEQ